MIGDGKALSSTFHPGSIETIEIEVPDDFSTRQDRFHEYCTQENITFEAPSWIAYFANTIADDPYIADILLAALQRAKAEGMRNSINLVLDDAQKDNDGTVTTGMFQIEEVRAIADKVENESDLTFT